MCTFLPSSAAGVDTRTKHISPVSLKKAWQVRHKEVDPGAHILWKELCVEAEEMYHQIASGRQAGSSMFGFDPQLTMMTKGNPSSCCVKTKPTSELACEIQTIQSNSIPAGGKLSVADDLQISGMERQEITLNKTILDEMRQALCRMHSSQECGNSATITAMPCKEDY
ncbi:hypothetical protein T4E_6777 [Trichinella pseudospiralis]|uniref:Uncharacterized protein n=1 Tax=Trichinella pseudospiralis TaxID=6337 RepID=A0A0V0Y9X1_TRIPS|nr:hypothetical protein T4E_6777 [Trichinella pseudospiralis]